MSWDHTSSSGAISMAVHRVPPEIWGQIFTYSILQPILHSSNDSLLRNIHLLHHDCEVSQAVEQTRTQIRLVCRFWNEITKRISPVLVQSTTSLPRPRLSTLRIEFKEQNCPCHPLRETPNWGVESEAIINKISYSFVEALISMSRDEEQPNLEQFPNLRLLSTRFFDPLRIPSKYPALVRNLTHLQVLLLYSKAASSKELIFPSLHTFSIEFSGNDYFADSLLDDEIGSQNLVCLHWSLPNLVNLACLGYVYEYWEAQMIYQLIERFGSKLEGFHMSVHDRGQAMYLELPKNLWSRCANLKTISTSLMGITSNARPPHDYPTFRLIFFDIDYPEIWRADQLCLGRRYNWMEYLVSICLFEALHWPINQLQMDTSWKRLERWLSTLQLEGVVIVDHFLDRLKWAGRDFKDRYGNGTESEEGKAFMHWLKNTINDLMRSQSWGGASVSPEESEAEFTDSEGEYISSNEGDESNIDWTQVLLHSEYEDSDEDDADYIERVRKRNMRQTIKGSQGKQGKLGYYLDVTRKPSV
ncbi:hypothetical protein CPB86DRAFT_878702 [Serendipita vermifera]|nr:hypothetical protein CPB86DRAFT_878702 [Serendipita vermifera]